MPYAVSALFGERDQAAAAIRTLRAHDYQAADISVVATGDDAESLDVATHQNTELERDVRAGVWAGSALGAAVAGYTALASLALIPALPLVMVGGAIIGGVAGSMGGLGLAQKDLDDLESTLRAGGALVVVSVDREDRAQRAHALLQPLKPQSSGLRQHDPITPVRDDAGA